MNSLGKQQLLLVAIVLAALAAFLTKAFHIDDPLFLWMAQQIAQHPLDPYGFTVNWASFPEPFWAQMQNPPLCSYFIAAVASIIGWSEPALHGAFLLWPVLSILGTFAVARRLCHKPLMAALLTLFTPVFLVSATNLMCDVMLLAFWIWSIELWLAGLERDRIWLLFASAIFATAAVLTKYFGVALVPLLAGYSLIRDWKKWPQLAALLIPLGAVLAYELWTKSLYGRGLLTAAMFFSRGATTKFASAAPTQVLIGLTFTGGCMVAPLFFIPGRAKFLLAALGVIATSLLLFFLFVPIDPSWALGQNITVVRIEGGLFAAIGMAVIAVAVIDLVWNRDAESVLLFLWLIGTFAFVTFFNWSITARTILPLTPVAAILLARFCERLELSPKSFLAIYGRLIPVAIVSLAVCLADFRQANSTREAAGEFEKRFHGDPGTIWFESHWGFQYYMQKSGATPVNSRDLQFAPGDLLMIPANNTLTIPIALERVFPPEEIKFSVLPLLTTMGRSSGACFYSSIRGPLPWVIDRVLPEMYYVARFR